jgi:hypothetical protein
MRRAGTRRTELPGRPSRYASWIIRRPSDLAANAQASVAASPLDWRKKACSKEDHGGWIDLQGPAWTLSATSLAGGARS